RSPDLLAADVEQRPIHAVVLVGEDAQLRGPLRQALRVGVAVALHGAHEHQQATADLAGDLVVDGDGCAAYPLDEATHVLQALDRVVGNAADPNRPGGRGGGPRRARRSTGGPRGRRSRPPSSDRPVPAYARRRARRPRTW